MPIAKTIYVCEHCNRRRLMSKSAIARHEKECWSNPEMKTCFSCKNQHRISVPTETPNTFRTAFECDVTGEIREFGVKPVIGCASYVNQFDYEEADC